MSDNALQVPTSQVLINKGIPVLVHKVEPAADGIHYQRAFTGTDDAAQPVFETRFIQFTMLTKAEIEERWFDPTPYVEYSVDVTDDQGKTEQEVRARPAREGEDGAPRDAIDVWQEALQERPNSLIVESLQLVWQMPREQVGLMLKNNCAEDYATALAGALMLANNGRADAVVRMLTQGVSLSSRSQALMADAIEEAVAELEAEDRKRQESANAAPDTQTPPASIPEPSPPSSLSDGANWVDPLQSSGV